MNEIYLDLNECRNPITGKGFVEYRIWNDYHDFNKELDSPEELGADSWAEVMNLDLFKRVVEDALDDDKLYDFLDYINRNKKGIWINDIFHHYDRLKKFLELLYEEE